MKRVLLALVAIAAHVWNLRGDIVGVVGVGCIVYAAALVSTALAYALAGVGGILYAVRR